MWGNKLVENYMKEGWNAIEKEEVVKRQLGEYRYGEYQEEMFEDKQA